MRSSGFGLSLAAWFLVAGLLAACEQGGAAQRPVDETPSENRPAVSLHGVSFPTGEMGWVIGRLGKIYYTRDAGATWTEQVSGTNRLLTAVTFVDTRQGWAVGEEGVILYTADGGTNWQRQSSGVTLPLFDVHFTDAKKGWAVGAWGAILFTGDGGVTWVDRSLSLPFEDRGLVEVAPLRDVIDPRTGETLARAEQLLTRSLAERIARSQIPGVRIREDVVLNSVFFLDETRGWIAGEAGLVLYTEDGGGTWARTHLPRRPAQAASGSKQPVLEKRFVEKEVSDEELSEYGILPPLPSLYAIRFTSPSQGWAVGQDGTVVASHDGGRQWDYAAAERTHHPLYDVAISGDRIWIIGAKGTNLVSVDGGRSWTTVDPGTDYQRYWLRRLAVAGDNVVIVGAMGLILSGNLASTTPGVRILNSY